MDFISWKTATDQHYFFVVDLLFDIHGKTNTLAYCPLSIDSYCNYVMRTLEMAKYDSQLIGWHAFLLIDDILFYNVIKNTFYTGQYKLSAHQITKTNICFINKPLLILADEAKY